MDAPVNILKALSDKTRLRIVLALLHGKRELCICEIMDVLELAQYNVSRHVRELKIAGLVRERKEGKFVFYALIRPRDDFHAFLLKALESLDAGNTAEDARRLHKRLALRVNGKCVVGVKQCCC